MLFLPSWEQLKCFVSDTFFVEYKSWSQELLDTSSFYFSVKSSLTSRDKTVTIKPNGGLYDGVDLSAQILLDKFKYEWDILLVA